VRRRIASVVVLALALSLAPTAGADEYVPSEPVHRPALGWICWPRRVLGDFDGDGEREPAVVWNRSGPHQVCDEREPESRWHVTLLLGNGVRLQRPLPCDTPWFCWPAAGDLDLDGRDELLVSTCCGAIIAEWRVYRLLGSELRPAVLAGAGAAGLAPGPLVLRRVSDSATHDGFGCRTHPNGVRVLVVYTGEMLRPGHWRFERARARGDGGAFGIIGVRRFRVEPERSWPRGPHVDPCFPTP
jgi:hypothetical protein